MQPSYSSNMQTIQPQTANPAQHRITTPPRTEYGQAYQHRSGSRLVAQNMSYRPAPPRSGAFMHSYTSSNHSNASSFSPQSPAARVVRSLTLDDPFVENGSPRTLPTNAASLAELIRSGAFDDGSSPADHPAPAPRSNRPEHHSALVASPVVHLCGAHMVLPVADPLFLIENRRPTLDEAMQSEPFTLPASAMPSADRGVVLVKNIPYGATKAEIIAAIGRNSRIVAQPVGTPFYAIHIIMERTTGKTMDCYVELESDQEARSIVSAYIGRCSRGRTPRVGERHVSIEHSNQEALMHQLFPKARCVKWIGMEPHAYQTNEAYNSGFRGFVTVEECAMIVKHAENPQRSPFVSRALNRSYESMISLLWKYPWFSIELVTVGERALLCKTTIGLLNVLFRAVSIQTNPIQLNQTLLQELLCAALTVPFSHIQKLEIASAAANAGWAQLVQSTGFAPIANIGAFWPFEALDKKPGVSDDTVARYAALLREANPAPLNPFGNLTITYPTDRTENLPLRVAAASEWEAMSVALAKVLKPVVPEQAFDAAPGAHLRAAVTAPVWRPGQSGNNTPKRGWEVPNNTPASCRVDEDGSPASTDDNIGNSTVSA